MDQKIELIRSEFHEFDQCYKERNFENALKCLEKILNLDPENFEALFFLGILNAQNKKFNEAKKIF